MLKCPKGSLIQLVKETLFFTPVSESIVKTTQPVGQDCVYQIRIEIDIQLHKTIKALCFNRIRPLMSGHEIKEIKSAFILHSLRIFFIEVTQTFMEGILPLSFRF